jgi:elongation factor G
MIVEVSIQPLEGARDLLGAALAGIAKGLGLDLADDPEAEQFIVGSRREDALEAALAILAERCPSQYVAGAIQPVVAVSIADSVVVTHDYREWQGGAGAFASVRLAVSPGEGVHVEFLDECPVDNLPPDYRGAIADAIARAEAHRRFGWPLGAMTVALKDGKYHDLDSSAEAFATATRRALDEAMMKGRMRLLEPVVAIAVVAPADLLDTCATLLGDRRLDFVLTRGTEAVSLAASARMIELLGFAADLRQATDGRADFAIALTGYAPISADDGPQDSEPMTAALRA